MKVKIKKLHENAVIPFKTYNSDFCYDLVAVSEEEIAPNVWKYGFGIAFQIERGFENVEYGRINLDKEGKCVSRDVNSRINFEDSPLRLSIDIRPRSSIYKTGMILSNSEGTVDENYTNEVSAIFYHVMPNMPRYKVGDKIAQMKIGFTFPIDFEVVDELEERDRGLNGYGSTN